MSTLISSQSLSHILGRYGTLRQPRLGLQLSERRILLLIGDLLLTLSAGLGALGIWP